VKVSSAKEDGVNVSAAAVLEVNRIPIDAGQQRSLFDRFGPVVSHGLRSPGANDVLGAIFDALKGDVLGGIGGADEEQSLARELICVAEIVRMHHTTGELFDAGEGRDVRGGIVTRGDDNVGEALGGQHDIVLEILDNDREVVGIFVVNDRFHGMGELHKASDVVFRPTSFLVVEKDFSGWETGNGFSVVLLESVVGELETLLGAVRPQITVHASMNWLAILIETSSPGIVPETAPVILLFKTNNFGDFHAGFFQLDEVVKSGTS